MADGNGSKLGVPLAVLVSALIATASLTFGVQSSLIYGRDLVRLTDMVEELAKQQRATDILIATLATNQRTHINNGGHVELEARVREIERQLPPGGGP